MIAGESELEVTPREVFPQRIRHSFIVGSD
jgi:hypothetical protein